MLICRKSSPKNTKLKRKPPPRLLKKSNSRKNKTKLSSYRIRSSRTKKRFLRDSKIKSTDWSRETNSKCRKQCSRLSSKRDWTRLWRTTPLDRRSTLILTE